MNALRGTPAQDHGLLPKKKTSVGTGVHKEPTNKQKLGGGFGGFALSGCKILKLQAHT